MFGSLILVLLIQGYLGSDCPVCDDVTDLRHCPLHTCHHPMVCEFQVINTKISSKCVHQSECSQLHESKPCTTHPGFFQADDTCKECCHSVNCTSYAIDSILPKLILSCPVCHHEPDAQKCLNNIQPCSHHDDMCELKTDGSHFSSRCEKKGSCTERLPSISAAGCINHNGHREDCIYCCTDVECFVEKFHLPFSILSTTPQPQLIIGGILSTTPQPQPIIGGRCDDDPKIQCNPSMCFDADLSHDLCPKTCGLCPTSSKPATVTTTHDILTFGVTSPQLYTAKPCKDENFPCNPVVCHDKDIASQMCPYTCGLCTTPPVTHGSHHTHQTSTMHQSTQSTPLLVSTRSVSTEGTVQQHTHASTTVPDHTEVPGDCHDDPTFDHCDSSLCGFPDIASPICQKTCGLCPSSTPPAASVMNTGLPSSSVTPTATGVISTQTKEPATYDVASTTISGSATTLSATDTPTETPTDRVTATDGGVTTTVKVPIVTLSTKSNVITTDTVTTKAQPHRMCQVCGDKKLGTFCTRIDLVIPPLKPCPGSLSFCMTDVYLSLNGPPKFRRRCANRDQCFKDWWQSTSDISLCVDSDPTIFQVDATCSYCCTRDGCNSGIIPNQETLFTD